MAKVKRLVTSASVAKRIENATENLSLAKNGGVVSAVALEKDRKRLLAETKRLAKKSTVLSKKKRLAAARLKKAPDAINRKALNAIVKEQAVVKKALEKARAKRAANAVELKALKTSLKQASAYLAAIAKVDKLLNKPKKKRSKKRVAKPAVNLSIVAA